MKITLNKRDFFKVLNNGGAFAGKSKTLPILDCVKIKIKNDSLLVVSTDNENAISARLTGMENNLEEDMSFCANYRDIKNYLSLIAGEKVSLSVELGSLTISHKNGRKKMPLFSAEDFPIMSKDTDYQSISFPSEVLSEWISFGQNFTASDMLRPVMTGIYFYGEKDEFGCCASEGHILFHDKRNMVLSEKFEFILNKTAFKAVSNVCAEAGDSNVSIRISSRNIIFSAENISVIARRIEGRYPNFKSVIPNRKDMKSVKLDKKDLCESINRCLCSANQSAPLAKLSLLDTKLSISCQDIDFNTSAEEIINIEGKFCMDIGVNANNLLTSLGVFENGELNANFISESKPLVITSEKEPNKISLCMPMML